MKTLLSLSLILALCCAQGYAFNATASFGSHGVVGWIRFTLSGPDDNVSITVNLAGLASNANGAPWSIRQFPVLTTLNPAVRGIPDNVGDVLDFDATPSRDSANCRPSSPRDCEVGDLSGRFGNIPTDFGTRLDEDTTGEIKLFGPNSIVGRSIVVMNGDVAVPATILLSEEEFTPPPTVTILTATFFSPVAGTIYFRQVEGFETTVFGKLFHVSGSLTSSGHSLSINTFEPPEGYQANLGCEVIGARYDPTGVSPSALCSTNMPTECEVGDLSGRFGSFTVESSFSPFSTSAFFFTDQNISLSGDFNILGRSVAISESGNPDSILACAPIVESEALFASQFDDFLLTIEDNSPYENSTLLISENYPANNPKVSILPDAFMTNGICTATDPSRVYNPFNVVATTTRGLTPDLFPLGDIPNKYNLLFFGPNLLELRELPLYGPNTLTSRTIRVTKLVNNANITSCSTLVPPKEDSGVMLKATFSNDPIKGGVYMIQNMRRDGSRYLGATNVVVDLYSSLSDATVTQNHNWVITEASCSDVMSGTDFTSFNPYDVSETNNNCSNLNQLRCANGDMGRKHSKLTLGPLSPTRDTYSFIDQNIMLSRNFSVNGLSLVVMGPEGASNVMACSTLTKLTPSQPANDIYFSTPVTDDFDRVKFLNKVTSVPPLNPMLPPSNILMLNQVVGAQTVPDSNTPCATFEMIVIAPTTEIANTYAEITQRSLCERFLADNACFKQFSSTCENVGVTLPDGAPALKSTVGILFGAVLISLAWFSV